MELKKNIFRIIKGGKHFVVAILCGSFKKINFMGLGIQIDVFAESMNGISLIIPEFIARIVFLIIMLFHVWVFIRLVFPVYKISFAKEDKVTRQN